MIATPSVALAPDHITRLSAREAQLQELHTASRVQVAQDKKVFQRALKEYRATREALNHVERSSASYPSASARMYEARQNWRSAARAVQLSSDGLKETATELENVRRTFSDRRHRRAGPSNAPHDKYY